VLIYTKPIDFRCGIDTLVGKHTPRTAAKMDQAARAT
jgi:hypothetical protein